MRKHHRDALGSAPRWCFVFWLISNQVEPIRMVGTRIGNIQHPLFGQPFAESFVVVPRCIESCCLLAGGEYHIFRDVALGDIYFVTIPPEPKIPRLAEHDFAEVAEHGVMIRENHVGIFAIFGGAMPDVLLRIKDNFLHSFNIWCPFNLSHFALHDHPRILSF